MAWLDRLSTLGMVLLLAGGCSDDGVPGAPADTDAAATETGNVTQDGMDEESGDTSADPTPGTTSGADSGGTGPLDTEGDSGNTGEETGGPPAVCEGPDDCVLVNDCCRCEVLHVDEVPACEMECDQPTCEALLIPPDIGTVCEEGECGFEPRNCASGIVSCAAVPPVCSDGLVPEVTSDGECWTGACIPVEACDGVPGCDACTDDEVCVTTETQLGPLHACEPIPRDCGGMPTCACLPNVCPKPFNTCTESEAGLQCSCPAC